MTERPSAESRSSGIRSGSPPVVPPHLLLLSLQRSPTLGGSMLDGDTIEVLHSTSSNHIRPNRNDCPRKGSSITTAPMLPSIGSVNG